MSRIGRFLIKAVLFQIGVYPVRYSETRHAEVAKRTFGSESENCVLEALDDSEIEIKVVGSATLTRLAKAVFAWPVEYGYIARRHPVLGAIRRPVCGQGVDTAPSCRIPKAGTRPPDAWHTKYP